MDALQSINLLFEASDFEEYNDRIWASVKGGPDAWMDPDCKLHPVIKDSHETWAGQYLVGARYEPDIDREEYPDADLESTYTEELYDKGWVRTVIERSWGDGKPFIRTLYVSGGIGGASKPQLAEIERLAIVNNIEAIIDGPNGGRVLYKPPIVNS